MDKHKRYWQVAIICFLVIGIPGELYSQQFPIGQQDIQLRPALNPALFEVEPLYSGWIADVTYRQNLILKSGPATLYARGDYFKTSGKNIWAAGIQGIKFSTYPIVSNKILMRGAVGTKINANTGLIAVGFSAGWQQYFLAGIDQLNPLFPNDPALNPENRNSSSPSAGAGVYFSTQLKRLNFRGSRNPPSLSVGFSIPQIGIKNLHRKDRIDTYTHYCFHTSLSLEVGNNILDGLVIAKYAQNVPVSYETLFRYRFFQPKRLELEEFLRLGAGISPGRLMHVEVGFSPYRSKRNTKPRLFFLFSYDYALSKNSSYISNTIGLCTSIRW